MAAAEEEASADQADEVERHARDGSWGTRAASRRCGPSTTDERGDSLGGDALHAGLALSDYDVSSNSANAAVDLSMLAGATKLYEKKLYSGAPPPPPPPLVSPEYDVRAIFIIGAASSISISALAIIAIGALRSISSSPPPPAPPDSR